MVCLFDLILDNDNRSKRESCSIQNYTFIIDDLWHAQKYKIKVGTKLPKMLVSRFNSVTS